MHNNIDSLLNEQEKMVIQNILSIQDYYHLKDHRKLISIILDKKQSQNLFGEKKVMISDVFQKHKNQTDQETKVNIFADKYTYQTLVQKFRKPRSFKNNTLTAVIKKKMQKQVIVSHNTRKSVWLLASGALFSMKNNKGLYHGLINYPDYPNYYQRAILLDLHRTVKKSQSSQDDTQSLQNLLIAFSRRNPYIGYCQGLNFIAYFLLVMQFNQQQAFWLLSQIIETVIPMDYYTNMIGVACDQQIFLQVLKIIRPNIMKKFNEVGLDGSVLCIQWFVCLFTSSLPFYLVKIVWDRLLVQGTQAFIKAGLIILSHFQKQILQTKQFYEIIMLVQKGSKNLPLSQQQFNKQFDKYYINTQGLRIARDLYRQFHIKQKLQQKLQILNNNTNAAKPKKQQILQCSTSWPLCTQYLNQNRRNMAQIQVWTYRQESSPKIIHDYMQTKKKKQDNLKSTILQQKLMKTGFVKPTVACSDFVIGRMEHICKNTRNQQKFEQQKKKQQRDQIKLLSMILQQEEDDEKKKENLQKILRLTNSQYQSYNQQSFQTTQSKSKQIIQSSKSEHHSKQQQKLDKNGFEKSQTIQFYSQFVSNNKQLVQMLSGKK